jgi:arylsulfatase A-like enzyme
MTYAESVEAVDRAIGGLIDLLDTHGLSEQSLMVLISDHGEALGEQHLMPSMPTHFGNPSFEPVLRIPLVVVGAEVAASEVPIRSEDVYHLLAEFVGHPGPQERDLAADELFLTEAWYRTYRAGRWKSFWRRLDGAYSLVDLSADPAESRDVADAHPEVAAAHRQRMDALTERLAAPQALVRELTEWERQTLSALGYLENTEKTNRAMASSDVHRCVDPRPEVCAQDYRPVCAARDNGVRCVKAPCPSTDRKTYPNACAACSDPLVYSHVDGACETVDD